MVSTQSLAIIFPVSDFRTGEDIAKASSSDPIVQKAVLDIESRFAGSVDVAQAMKNLSNVGLLLQLAYSSSKGFPCNVKVVAILSKYQTLIKDSSRTCNTFVDSCLTALKLHKLAIALAEKDKTDRAIVQIVKTGELAKEMAKVSGELVAAAKNLCDMSEDALIAATQDETITTEKRKQVEKMMAEFEASQKNLETKLAGLQEDIADRTKAVEKAQTEARDARDKAFVVSMVSAFTQPVVQVATSAIQMHPAVAGPKMCSQFASMGVKVNPEQVAQVTDMAEKAFAQRVEIEAKKKLLLELKEKMITQTNQTELKKLEAQASKVSSEIDAGQLLVKNIEGACKKVEDSLKEEAKLANDKESAIQTKLDELKKDKRESNAQLQETIIRLKNSNIEKDYLASAITSLEVTVRTLGKIKVVFENVRQFWTGVEAHCNKLAKVDVEGLQDNAILGPDALVNEFKESGLNWLSLGRVNYVASMNIRLVEDTVDGIMSNLPSRKEAEELVKQLSDRMLAELEVENKALKN